MCFLTTIKKIVEETEKMDPSLTCSFLVWLQLMAYFLSNWDNNGSPPTRKQEVKPFYFSFLIFPVPFHQGFMY